MVSPDEYDYIGRNNNFLNHPDSAEPFSRQHFIAHFVKVDPECDLVAYGSRKVIVHLLVGIEGSETISFQIVPG